MVDLNDYLSKDGPNPTPSLNCLDVVTDFMLLISMLSVVIVN